MAAALAAAKVRLRKEAAALSVWRDELEADISRVAPGAAFFGGGAERLPNTSCFALRRIEAHVLLIALDLEGIAVSSGSACSSGKVKRSHVLSAMGVEPDVAGGAIRVSLGWNSRREDCILFVRALERTVSTIRARRDKSAA
jgi:cysteine desulfurase